MFWYQGHCLIANQQRSFFRKISDANFWARQIYQNGEWSLLLLRDLPKALNRGSVPICSPMRHIKSGDIDPCIQEPFQIFW